MDSDRTQVRKNGLLPKLNLVDTGISIILGSAFSAMVQTFVDDLLTPLLGLVVGSRMSNWFIVLRNGSRALESATQRGKPVKYVTIEEAHRDGAVTLNVGRALESVVRFACLASAVFTFYRVALKTWEANKKTLAPILFPNEPPHSDEKADGVFEGEPLRECSRCISQIPRRATRCRYCTAEVRPTKEE